MTIWNKNLWETPDHVARSLVDLLEPSEDTILEPFAGSGQIAKFLCQRSGIVDAVELGFSRSQAIPPADSLTVYQGDFIAWKAPRLYDAVVTNPPFDLGIEGLEKALSCLKPGGRCLFLLPCAFFHTKERAARFKSLDAYIYKQYAIVGRVAYLKEGVPHNERQCDDSIFDIRRASDIRLFDSPGAGMEFIWQ